jgi:hypothetical protein
MRLTIRTAFITVCLLGSAVFLVWRFVRPMNIFVVTEAFERAVDTSSVPAPLSNLSAEECAVCHREFYAEWRTSMHSRAWTDPYFQADWQFEGSQQICRNCHTPLDRQQPQKVLGFKDREKWDPLLAPNPEFDAKLQHEGVTCAACHVHDGAIVGVFGDTGAPHAVKKISSGNEMCMRCHVVEGERWDTFFRFPPCGTVAEIESTLSAVPDRRDPEGVVRLTAERDSDSKSSADDAFQSPGLDAVTAGHSGEITAGDPRALGCVQCHMPLVKRPLVEGGVVRTARQHLWRGGHDPEMVREALSVAFAEKKMPGEDARFFRLTLTNTGAAHYLPTGTPDRHLTVHLRSLDDQGSVLDEQNHTIKRTVMWRPFIVDLRDTRLPRWRPRHYEHEVPVDSAAARVEAEIRYHLLAENRRRRIGYENKTPINYEVLRKTISLRAASKDATLE